MQEHGDGKDYFGNYNDALKPLAFMLFVSAFIFWRINPNEQLVDGDEIPALT